MTAKVKFTYECEIEVKLLDFLDWSWKEVEE